MEESNSGRGILGPQVFRKGLKNRAEWGGVKEGIKGSKLEEKHCSNRQRKKEYIGRGRR